MPFKVITRGPVLYVSWGGFTLDDLHAVMERIAELHVIMRRGVVYVSRIPADHRVFSSEENAVLLEFLLAILPSCASIHHVIEGDGFIKSARRATVTNMALSTPRARDFHTHATLTEAADAVQAAYGIDLHDIAAARASVAPTPPEKRASGAFRAATRIAQHLEPRRPPTAPKKS